MKSRFLAVLVLLFFPWPAAAIQKSALYETLPDVARCNPGVLKQEEKTKVLGKLNQIRRLHGLNPVEYEPRDDQLTAKAALIIAANATLSHFPDKSFKCWSKEGEAGSSTSNLHISYYGGAAELDESESFVVGWLIDEGVESLGHRRWLLDPFLKTISFGRVDGKPLVPSQWDSVSGAAVKVIHEERAELSDQKADFVAYPHGDYPPELFSIGWYLSFSALADKEDPWGNRDVDYAAAKIEVQDEAGKRLKVSGVKHDNSGFGLPNFLQWKVEGLRPEQRYQVKISGVKRAGKVRDYAYWFKITEDAADASARVVPPAAEQPETPPTPLEPPVASPEPAQAGTTGEPGSDYLDALEKEVLSELNALRADPAAYAAHAEAMLKLFNGKLLKYPGDTPILTKEGTWAVKECVKALRGATPLPLFTPSRGLSQAAADLVADQSQTGATDHAGGDGSSPFERMDRYGTWEKTAGENIDYGNSVARRVVLSLLIDDGVPSRGHRKNLLNPDFRVVGIACGTHPVYRHMCVLDFAGGFAEGKE